MEDAVVETGLPAWYAGLRDEVWRELDRLTAAGPHRGPALEREAASLRSSLEGWSRSLGNPGLDASLRSDLEGRYGVAKHRLAEVEVEQASLASRPRRVAQRLDPARVLDRLRRLASVLGSRDVTTGNVELSRHVERIEVGGDGSVVMRTCRLGVLGGLAAELADPDRAPPAVGAGERPKPRPGPRRRAEAPAAGPGPTPPGEASDVVEPSRFAGLAPKWFWEDVLDPPKRTSWGERHYAAVAAAVREHPRWSKKRLAEHFGVSVPTLRPALLRAGVAVPKNQPPGWSEVHAAEVAAVRREHPEWTQGRLAGHFGVSIPTVLKALRLADPAAQGESKGGGRQAPG